MRICFVLLLAVTALVTAVSGSSVNLRDSQRIGVVHDKTSDRALRGDLNTDEATEERASFDFVKKLVAKVKGDPLRSFAKRQTKYIYSDLIFDDLLKKFPDPDALHNTLKLHILKNRSNKYGVTTARFKLHQNFLTSYIDKFPNWRSKLN